MGCLQNAEGVIIAVAEQADLRSSFNIFGIDFRIRRRLTGTGKIRGCQ